MEAIIGAKMHIEPSTSPRGSMGCINGPPDREPDTQDSGDGEVDIDEAPEPQTIPDEGKIDDSDDESVPTASEKEAKSRHEPPPTVKQLE
jgi:hypothetical protein